MNESNYCEENFGGNFYNLDTKTGTILGLQQKLLLK